MQVSKWLDDSADARGYHVVMLTLTYAGRRVRMSSEEKVLEKDWNAKKEIVKGSDTFADSKNYRIDQADKALRDAYYAVLEGTPKGEKPDREAIKQRALALFSPQKIKKVEAEPTPPKPTLLEFWPRFAAEHQGQYSPDYLRHFTQVRDAFSRFHDVQFDELTLPLLNEWLFHLANVEELADSTIGGHVKRLRRVLEYAADCHLTFPPDYKKLPIGQVTGERLFLLPVEFEHLFLLATDSDVLPARAKLTAARFMLACTTGFRHSDLSRLSLGRVTQLDGYRSFQLRQKKTISPVTVPFNDYSAELVDRWGAALFEGFNTRAQQTYNVDLKDMAKRAELTRPVVVGRVYRGELAEQEFPLHDVLSSHAGRHTFGFLSIYRGMAVTALQKFMGHRSIASTQVYVHLVDQFLRDHMVGPWTRDADGRPAPPSNRRWNEVAA